MNEKLKEIRLSKGYKIEELANLINTSPCNYLKKENGQVKFSVSEALIIANFFKTKVEKIFTNQLSENEINKGEVK